MLNHHTTELFIQDLEVPADNLIGAEGMGFRYIIDGWNAERILIASESLGDGRWFVERAARYASERVVFGRPIGANQGVQFPIAQAHARLEAADLLRAKAAWLFDTGQKCGAEANMAKLLASQAATSSANSARRACTAWRRSTTTSCSPMSANTCWACPDRTELSHAQTPRRGVSAAPSGRLLG